VLSQKRASLTFSAALVQVGNLLQQPEQRRLLLRGRLQHVQRAGREPVDGQHSQVQQKGGWVLAFTCCSALIVGGSQELIQLC
jgi:hypothetical protein